MPTQNEIVFPAAILQPPFFHKSLESIDFDIKNEIKQITNVEDAILSINHGAIGAVIAHEITHGYDIKGRKFDENGNLNDWWNDNDVELFSKKCELMKHSVLKYKFTDGDKEYDMKPELTMGKVS